MKVVRLKPYVRAMRSMGLSEEAQAAIELSIVRALKRTP